MSVGLLGFVSRLAFVDFLFIFIYICMYVRTYVCIVGNGNLYSALDVD